MPQSSFDLVSWLKNQVSEDLLDCPLLDSPGQLQSGREWLITNGLGSYASADVSGANTRRYHGLFVAALQPPVQRTLMLSRIDEEVAVHYKEQTENVSLATNYWKSGEVAPKGFQRIASFAATPVPTWAYRLRKGMLIKQVAMLHEKQEVHIGYTWDATDKEHGEEYAGAGRRGLDASETLARHETVLELKLHVLVNYRDFHGQTKGFDPWQFEQICSGSGVRIKAFTGAEELTLSFNAGAYEMQPSWYWNYAWPRECERGLSDHEDNFHAGILIVRLHPGASISIKAAIGEDGSDIAAPLPIKETVAAVWRYQKNLLQQAGNPANEHYKRLVVAADAFLVKRVSTAGHSIIAGYHWFSDWGRDAMISLPGLTLAAGRSEAARSVLETFGKYLSDGMIPNCFPDNGEPPQYNSVDATLWWAWSIYEYYQNTADHEFVCAQLPLLDSVFQWFCQGARYGIKMDESDGLIQAGIDDVQLTWMDAKVDGRSITPRHGKPVEVNALWYNFLKIMELLHRTLEPQSEGASAVAYALTAEKVKHGFSQFWNPDKMCLFDVIATNNVPDDSVRPNQIFAVSLPFPLVSTIQARSILQVVERELLTGTGLRTLSPRDPAYKGQYGGGRAPANQYERDASYHQGTAWPWLFGAWVDARVRVHGSGDDNFNFIRKHLLRIENHIMREAGIGFISEIFDGDEPHRARGCIAQAWSVAELLRIFAKYPSLSRTASIVLS